MRPKLSQIALFAAALALSGMVHFDASAHKGAKGVVKHRMHVMKGMGDNMKSLKQMFDGEIPYEAAKAEAAAASIEKHGGAALTKMFPKGSMQKPTEATPKIWENWESFEANAMRLQAYAGALKHSLAKPSNAVQPAAAAGDMTQFGAEGTDWPAAANLQDQPPQVVFNYVAKTCKSCHESYRIKKKD
jgi:cytochrome c556